METFYQGAYIGIPEGDISVARKIKNAYIGIEDCARRVLKAYIGDADGVARLWWYVDEVEVDDNNSSDSGSTEVDTTTLAGTWVFNEDMEGAVSTTLSSAVNFTSNEISYTLLEVNTGAPLMGYFNTTDTSVCVYAYGFGGGGWADEAYRTIVIDAGQTDATLLTFLQAYAVKTAN